MSERPFRPVPADTSQTGDRSEVRRLPAWVIDQPRRVLRTLEGRGPVADERVREGLARVLARFREAPPPEGSDRATVRDHLWGALLRAGLPQAARFFRPYGGAREPLLWVRRPGGGADPLARRRVEALLDRLCERIPPGDLEPTRIRRYCGGQLSNGIEERQLVRILALTSPAEAAILRRAEGRPRAG